MDSYLEGVLWPDVHQRLTTRISEVLALRIRPRYVARLAVKTIHENVPAAEINLIYPAVEILHRQVRERPPIPYLATAVSEPATISPALTIPAFDIKQRMVTVELFTVEERELVTSIEVLSRRTNVAMG